MWSGGDPSPGLPVPAGLSHPEGVGGGKSQGYVTTAAWITCPGPRQEGT